MHRSGTRVLLLYMSLSMIGCTRALLLEGPYHLVSRAGCNMGEVSSDRLVLHSDGTFEQHTISKSGARYDSSMEKWKFVGDKSIQLDSWNDFSGATTADFRGNKKSVVLKVEISHPQIIFAPSGCIYTQPK